MPGDRPTKALYSKRNERNSELSRSNLACTVQTMAMISLLRPPHTNQGSTQAHRHVHNGHIVEKDGSTNTNSRDPPGQSSVYIPPGDHWREAYRLTTFNKWPHDAQGFVNDLAANGFYYTGFKDRVRCFSCGMAVDNWMVDDVASDTNFHKTDCGFLNGIDHSNVPTGLTMMKEKFRNFLTSPKQTYKSSSACGFEYAMSGQVNGIVTGGGNVPPAKAAIQAPIVVHDQISSQQFPSLGFGEIHSLEHKQLLRSLHLEKEIDRRKTFSKWPSYPAPELPSRLAAEGFFYLGDFDRVQCFSCSGVLRNWAKNDNPRTEHRKHFPRCRVVLELETFNISMSAAERRSLDEDERRRRISFSAAPPPDPTQEEQRFLDRQFPCINPVNPSMQKLEERVASFNALWPSHRLKASREAIAKAGFFFLGQGDKTKCFYCNGGLQNWDEFDEPWTEHAKWFPGCEFVLRMKGLTFVKDLVKANPNLARPAIRNPAFYDIDYPSHSSMDTTPVQFPMPGSSTSNNEDRTDEETLNQLLSERLCKRCYKETSDNLIQPCGHIALCSNCTFVHYCPVCNAKIDSIIKIYRM